MTAQIIPFERPKKFGPVVIAKRIDPVGIKDWREVGSVELTKKARRYLKDRGISEEVWTLNHVRSLTPEQTAAIWGSRCKVEGILFPFAKDYAVVRLLGRKERKFRTTPGRGQRVYVPALPSRFKKLSMDDVLSDAEYPLLLCEGPTRVLAAIRYGKLAIGISGCWNWQKDRRPLKQLRNIKWKAREVTPIFDADVTQNPSVALPFLLLGDWLLEARRAKVRALIGLPKVAGPTTGLDDYLAKKGAKKFDELKCESWDDSSKLAELRLAALRKTEGGLAALFALRYHEDARYDAEEECWYAWAGTHWERQTAKALRVQEYVKETVTWILREGVNAQNEKRRKALVHWATQCDRSQVIRGAMTLAASDNALRIRTMDLDANPYLLGTSAGVIDLRSGELIEAERAQLITRIVAADYNPEAECPRWKQFVSEIMKGKQDMIEFLQQLCGYLLLGDNRERLLFFLWGSGRNGKSVFIETMLKLLGDYGEPAKSSMIMKHYNIARDSEGAQPFMLRLRGKRLITASEVDEGMVLDGGTVKDLTGNDMITVRGLRANPVKFVVEGKILVRCNHRPQIDTDDQAVWDRVVEIPFLYRVPEDEQDKNLGDKLREELSGILNWALAGFKDYHKLGGLRLPEDVKGQTEAYRDDMDTVLKWLSENTREGDRTSLKVLYKDYQEWCNTKSRPGRAVFAQSKKAFAQTLRNQNLEVRRGKAGERRVLGLQLI